MAALQIRIADIDPAVEAARPQQGRIENVLPIGGANQNHAFRRIEAVDFDQELVQRLVMLVMATATTAAVATAPDGVDLVDEDDARRLLAGGAEQGAHAARAETDEHLDEFRARDREERHLRLAGHGAGKQGLAGARRPEQQHSLRHAATEKLEPFGIFEEGDDLAQFFLRILDASDIGKG